MSHRFVPFVSLLLSLFLVACATEQHVVKDTWGDFERSVKGEKFRYGDRETDQSRRLAHRNTMSDPGDNVTAADDSLHPQSQEYWSILLASFTGSDQQKQASDLVDQLKHLNISDAWFAEEDGYTHVYRGKFSDPTKPQVQSALRQSRMIKINDQRPFARARIVAAKPALAVSQSQMDLKRYRDQGLWSLQIAVYDDQAGSNYKRLAEEAATNLRKDGDMAFFYHGPFRSMVTVGLYSYDQAWTQRLNVGDTYSPAIRKLQKKYPYNLYNGRTVIEKVGGKKVREQPSFLVQVK